ncbi:MAG: hypothetical protein Kow0027_21650 [Saprospiraceae bacterium]
MSQPKQTTAALVLLPATDAYPKGFDPLQLRIYGLTLFERTLKALERGGCGHILILTPRASSGVQQWLKIRQDWEAQIEVQQSENPAEDQNRTLAALAADSADGVVLVREPIVFDQKLIPWLKGQKKQPAAVANGLLTFLPKEKTGKGQWEKEVRHYTPDFLLCHSVKTVADKKTVKKLLRQSLIKPTDGWVSRHLNRPVSISISRVLAHTPITPNQFTVFTGLLGVLTAYLLSTGPYWGFMIGAFLFHFTSILDGVDGELARLKFKASPFGQWLDTLVDNSSYVLALIGYLIGLYNDGVTPFEKWAGISTLVFTTLALASMYYYLKRFDKGGSLLNIEYSYKEGNGWSDKLLRSLAPLGKRDLFALIFFLLGLLGQLHLALVFISVMTAILFALSIKAHVDTARQLRSERK